VHHVPFALRGSNGVGDARGAGAASDVWASLSKLHIHMAPERMAHPAIPYAQMPPEGVQREGVGTPTLTMPECEERSLFG